jgi:hypothetical protein
MKSMNLFILNVLLIGGLTIPTCNKAKAAEKLDQIASPKINATNIITALPINHHFKIYPQ